MKQIVSFILFLIAFTSGNAQSGKLVFTSKEKTRIGINKNYHYRFDALDSAGNFISYSVTKSPSWVHFNLRDHSISGKTKAAGQYFIEITATTRLESAKQQFMLTVYDGRTTNILCLGNSITNGVDTFNSYRRDLWQLLHAGHYDFDFIGSWSGHHMGSSVPLPDFDMDHEGHSGWTFEDILHPPSWDSTRGDLHQWIRSYMPSIVLIELGTNDIFHCRKPKEMFRDLDTILSLLRNKNGHVKIFLAQIPPLGAQWSDKKLCGNDTSYSSAIMNLNSKIVDYAKGRSTVSSPVIVVDQFTGVGPAKDMFDDIHPNTRGEKKMAERWFNAVKLYLDKL